MKKSLLLSLLLLFGLTQSAFAMEFRPYSSTGQEQLNSHLHQAIQRDDEVEVRRLIESGANVNLPSAYGFTPLMQAIQRGQEQVCKCLLSHDADINFENENGETALLLAAQFRQESIFKLLIDHKANVHHKNAKGNTPFIEAARAGWEATCIYLIKLGVNPHHENNDGETALMQIIHVWRMRMKLILFLGLDKDLSKEIEKYKSTCELLIRLGANVNHANMQGDTALMIAAGHSENNHPIDPGNEQICRFLIEHGANVNQANRKGINPLLVSVGRGVLRCTPDRSDEQICKLLIESGANMNHQDTEGFTALMHASQHGYSHICKLLLSNDADVNIQGRHNDTALTIAARYFQINAITHASFNTVKSIKSVQHSPNNQRNNSNNDDLAYEPILGTPISLDASGKICSALFASDHKLRVALRYLIKNEQEKISIAVYVLTDASIAQELIRAHRRGVVIELLTDPSCLRNPDNKIEILAQAGIPIYIYRTGLSGIMHNKFALFGRTIYGKAAVWTGSFNFTKRANEANQENVVVLDDINTIEKYTHEFERLKNKAIRYIQLDEQILSLPLQEVRALIQSGKLDKEKAIALIKEHNLTCLKPLLEQAIQSTHPGRLGLLPRPDTLEKNFGAEIENNIRKKIDIASSPESSNDEIPTYCTVQ
jgi:ankyrin repeat protein